MKEISNNLMNDICVYMDSNKREQIAARFTPCSNAEFLKQYCKLDEDFLNVLEEEFHIDTDDMAVDEDYYRENGAYPEYDDSELPTKEDLERLEKFQQVKRLSKVGAFGDTFRANYSRIPEDIKEVLTAKQVATLVDCFYDCYGAGKNSKTD